MEAKDNQLQQQGAQLRERDVQLRERGTQINRQQRELEALRVGNARQGCCQ